MPYGDKTGPNRQGPRTGRGYRNCNGQGGAGRGASRGMGHCSGWGARRGQDRGDAPGNAGQENSWIVARLNSLQAAIEKLSERLGKDV